MRVSPDQVPPVLYHWTEAINAPGIVSNGLAAGAHLTSWADAPELAWNEDIFWLYRPARIGVDTGFLDCERYVVDVNSGQDEGDSSFEKTGNLCYLDPVSDAAITGMELFPPRQSWKMWKEDPSSYGYPETYVDGWSVNPNNPYDLWETLERAHGC